MTRSGTATYNNDELEITIKDKTYRIDVQATASYYYDSGCMYMRNGDPGYPPESEFDVEDVYSAWTLIDEDDPEKDIEVEATKEMEEYLYDYLNDMDYDKWTFDYE